MPQHKQNVKSEYSKSFKTYKEEAQAGYNENFKFRMARRDHEVSHQPWAWLDIGVSEGEEEDTGEVSCPGDKGDSNDTEETDSDYDASGAVVEADTAADCEDDLVASLTERAMRRVREIRSQNGGGRVEGPSEGVRRPRHPTKGSPPHRWPSRPRAAKVDPQPATPRPAFLCYGWATPTPALGHKATFNIRADTDVHPSASRALRMREARRLHQASVAARRQPSAPVCRSACSARSAPPPEVVPAADWQSEYQRGYPGYEDEVYRRGLANLAPRGRAARLAAPRTCRI